MAIPKRPSAATFPAFDAGTPATPTATMDSWGDAKKRGHFVGLYGVGGAGKTTLAAMIASLGKTAFVDLEGSLVINKAKLTELGLIGNIVPKFIRYNPDDPATAWEQVCAFLRGFKAEAGNYTNLVIDSFTRAEENAKLNCIHTVRGDSVTITKSIEQWTYGKGAQIVFDKFVPIYPLIDEILAAGCNVIAIAHDSPTNVANPDGGNYLQHQPALVQGEKGKAAGRDKFTQTVDHLLFLAKDVSVEKGKATGGMTRTLYCGGIASMMAKSRTVDGTSFDVPNDSIFDWSQIIHD